MNPRHCFWSGVIALGALWLLLAVLLVRLVPHMEPVKPGIIEEFWEKACGAVLDPTSTRDASGGPFSGGPSVREAAAGKAAFCSRQMIYGPFDGWYVYERSHMHGSDLFRVPEAEVRGSFGSVIELLEKPDNRNALEPAVRKALVAWEKLPPGSGRNEVRLLELVQEEQLELRKEWGKDLHDYALRGQNDIHERWLRSKNYSTAIAFESVYLGILILFFCWPLLRGKGGVAWAIHLAAAPFLFMLPAYLGYATMSFSSMGPSGGVAYPWLLQCVPGSWFPAFDRTLFLGIPKTLEPLSQTTGLPVALSWRSMPGPATALAADCLLAGVALFVKFIPRFREQARKRYFSARREGADCE